MPRLLLGFLIAAHGLIHLGFVAPAPADPVYPFRLNQSWLITSLGLSEAAVRPFGIVLAAVTVAGFALAALAAAGLIVPQAWWPALAVVSSAASLLLLVFFWHNWLVIGVVIDIALLLALLVFDWKAFPAA